MMNAADEGDNGGRSNMPFGFPPMGDRESAPRVPDFLTRRPVMDEEKPSVPDFETFKRQLERQEELAKETQPVEIPGKLSWGPNRKCHSRDFTGARLGYQCQNHAPPRTISSCQPRERHFS